jgi:GTP cyclohydrolase IA
MQLQRRVEMIQRKKNKKEKTSKKRIEKLIRGLLIELGENPDREGLVGTPARIAEMYQEIFAGYRMNDDAELDVSFVSEEIDAIVVKDIRFYSMCEHHMLPFYGKIQIVYIPSGKVFGISKLNHVVERYARRLQIQERLTRQIADAIIAGMGVKGISVVVEAKHLCMKMRGVRNDSSVITECNRGVMEQKEFREHVVPLIHTSAEPKLRTVV